MTTTIRPYTERIIEKQGDEFRVQCGTCRGSREYNGICSVCNGDGAVLLQATPDDADYTFDENVSFVRCGRCSGSGRYSWRCNLCNGVGGILGIFPRARCSVCGGSGEHHGRCSACGGVGSVAVEGVG